MTLESKTEDVTVKEAESGGAVLTWSLLELEEAAVTLGLGTVGLAFEKEESDEEECEGKGTPEGRNGDALAFKLCTMSLLVILASDSKGEVIEEGRVGRVPS